MAKVADGTKQAHCDLLTALDDRIKQVIDAQKPAPPPPALPPVTKTQMMYLPSFRGAADDEYMRNAYAYDEERNAYVEDEYMRNAYGYDDERNAYVEDERNAYVEDERNAYVEDERNADNAIG
jgi:hypothetical protein